ncbi:MAG: CBS domain-containing protein [Desulfarculus sp.]|nr:CBS domain-containing protein [Desulfarculus sp.]
MAEMTIRQVMTPDPVTVTPETPVSRAAALMLERRINGLPVVDGSGALVGIICQSDLIAEQKKLPLPSFFTLLDGYIPLTSLKHLEREVERIAAVNVGQAMTRQPVTVGPETPLSQAAALMVDHNFHTLPVLDQGRLVGVVGKEDLLRSLFQDQG